MIKARLPEKDGRKPGSLTGAQSDSWSSNDSVWEGMTRNDFYSLIKKYFIHILGNNDHSSLIDRALRFADFNKDGQV